MDKNNSSVLKVFGIVMILFGAVYAILGTVALMGELGGLLPAHADQETLIVVLAYGVALLAIICGVACVKGAVGVCERRGRRVPSAGTDFCPDWTRIPDLYAGDTGNI